MLVDEDAPAESFARRSSRVRGAIERLPSPRRPVRARRVALPAGEALLFQYGRTVPGPRGAHTVWTMHYVLAAGGQMVALVFSAPADRLKPYRPTFRAAARTLVFR